MEKAVTMMKCDKCGQECLTVVIRPTGTVALLNPGLTAKGNLRLLVDGKAELVTQDEIADTTPRPLLHLAHAATCQG